MWQTVEAMIRMFVPVILQTLVKGSAGVALGTLVTDSMTAVETQMGPGTGASKKAAVLAVATDAIATTNAAKGSVVLNPDVTLAQVSTAIDLGIGIVNDIRNAHAAATPAVPSVPPPSNPPTP